MKNNLPVMLLKKIVLLPREDIRLDLNNEISNQVVDLAIKKHNSQILIVCSKDPYEESPDVKDLPSIGVIGKIKSCLKLPNGKLRIVVTGEERVKIVQYINELADGDILKARTMQIDLPKFEEVEETTLRRKIFDLFNKYTELSSQPSESIQNNLKLLSSLNEITDLIVNNSRQLNETFLNYVLNERIFLPLIHYVFYKKPTINYHQLQVIELLYLLDVLPQKYKALHYFYKLKIYVILSLITI